MRRSSVVVLLLAISASALPAQDPPERGRDPWVFRCIFEDRTRMVLGALGERVWFAWNPETGSLHRVWQGKVAFKGKVWDFSQNSSHAVGVTWMAPPRAILTLPDARGLPPGWSAQGGVRQDDGWRFDPGARIQPPPIDLTGWRRAYVAFDERSVGGRLRFTGHTGAPDPWYFESCLHNDRDDRWQWNFQRVPTGGPVGLVIESRDPDDDKRLRNFRIFGDRPAWYLVSSENDAIHELEVRYRGHQLIGKTHGVALEIDLLHEGQLVARVRQVPDRTADSGLRLAIEVDGLAEGTTIAHVPPRPTTGRELRARGSAKLGTIASMGSAGRQLALLIAGNGRSDLVLQGSNDR